MAKKLAQGHATCSWAGLHTWFYRIRTPSSSPFLKDKKGQKCLHIGCFYAKKAGVTECPTCLIYEMSNYSEPPIDWKGELQTLACVLFRNAFTMLSLERWAVTVLTTSSLTSWDLEPFWPFTACLWRQGWNEAKWIFQFSNGMDSTFIVHRTIQVLIWGRMTSCEEHRLDRLSVRFCFNIRALGSQMLVLHIIESIDIKLLGFKIKCVCVYTCVCSWYSMTALCKP